MANLKHFMNTHKHPISIILASFALMACDNASQLDTKNDSQLVDISVTNELSTEKNVGQLHVGSPDWREQVIYFLMIDRFEDADPSNNDQGYGEYDKTSIKHFMGGDLQGITNKLNYIEELGMTSVWLTPPVRNQWYSHASDYFGYHGYWASDFNSIDPHFGNLQDYKQLSKSLHAKGMYLIQDIVLNHTGIFFGYEGEYDPQQTQKNFTLFKNAAVDTPTQSPFDMYDRNNPEHKAANIYNWTPSITDYNDPQQQFTHQLGNLSDLNTKNETVLQTFKDTYKYWMSEAGVDAYRIDTVKYVEHEFWNQFLHDNDGINKHALDLGKTDFLSFGEVFEYSPPLSNSGEQKVVSFINKDGLQQLDTAIGFPLYFTINTVFGESKPTHHLAYRLERFMLDYPNPFIVPNFIDNHDTKRFLAGASIDSFKQALALLFTIPGIPVIYQGSEQAFTETRQPMFVDDNTGDHFDQSSELFRFIKSLSALRLSDKLFTRGDLSVLASDHNRAGLLAYKRSYENRHAIVLFNTASHSILVNQIDTQLAPGTNLHSVFSAGFETNEIVKDNAARLSLTMPANSVLILEPTEEPTEPLEIDALNISFNNLSNNEVLEGSKKIEGTSNLLSTSLLLIVDGNLDTASTIKTDNNGDWLFDLRANDLGEIKTSIELYSPEHGVSSEKRQVIMRNLNPDLKLSLCDPRNDDNGLDGSYTPPLQSESHKQMDILQIDAEAAGSNLNLNIKMAQVSDVWKPSNGFDNVSFSIFFDIPSLPSSGASALPIINSTMPNGTQWKLGHVLYGWGNYIYTNEDASTSTIGKSLGVSPKVTVDTNNNEITIQYLGKNMGVSTWQNSQIYITTWDISGEGKYRDIDNEAGEWTFGGANKEAAKIMDAAWFELKQGELVTPCSLK